MLRDKECIYLANFVWDRSVGIPMDYVWKAGVRPESEARNCSLLHSVQTATGAHPTPYLMCNGDSFPAGKGAHLHTALTSRIAEL
jgi:hypothetical protein